MRTSHAFQGRADDKPSDVLDDHSPRMRSDIRHREHLRQRVRSYPSCARRLTVKVEVADGMSRRWQRREEAYVPVRRCQSH